MAREIKKAISKGINATGDVIEAFANAYTINTQIEVVENLSDSDIKGTDGLNLEQKATLINNIYNLMKRK